MIREFVLSDMDDVLNIWLKASIDAHHFISEKFWSSKLKEMREIYIPMSETYVYETDQGVIGFFSLHKKVLAAIFVSPDEQGKGIGKALIKKAISIKNHLSLTVYRENYSSIAFYKKIGFCIIGKKIDKHTGHEELLMEYSMGK